MLRHKSGARRGQSSYVKICKAISLCVIFLLGFAQIAHAAPLKFDVVRDKTGGVIGPLNTVGDDLCPSDPTNGCDFDDSDNVVRTNDGVSYRFAVQVDAPGDTVFIESVLKPGMVWDDLPGSCNPFTSTITGDGTAANPSKITCDLGFQSSWAADIGFVARALGDNPNGSSSGLDSAKLYGTASPEILDDLVGVDDYTITAAPRMDLFKKLSGVVPSTHNGVAGARVSYQFWIQTWKHDTNGNSSDDPDPSLGNEMVQNPLTWTEDLTGISPNAYVISCAAGVSSSIFPWRTYNTSQPDRSVLDAGTATCSNTGPTATGSVNVTLTGADLSLSHAPSRYRNGSAISNDYKIASFGIIQVFVPLADIDAAGGQLAAMNSYSGFDPVSITGQSNFLSDAEDEANNSASHLIASGPGSFSHTYRCYHLHVPKA